MSNGNGSIPATLTVVMTQSTREKGSFTKNMVLFEEQGNGMRKVYVNQQALLSTFGRIPKQIIIHVLDGDEQPKAAA